MSEREPSAASTKHYFVDEAGDPTLFDASGKVIAGEPGCSSHFILGMLDIEDPSGLSKRLKRLHEEIRADSYLQGVPSLAAKSQKTSLLFHAKDDIPEIRERVFRLLQKENLRFFAVVRDKRDIARHVHQKNLQSRTYRYQPNRLYDQMVRRLFKDRLHKANGYQVCFARRGSKDRTVALKTALEQARENFRKKWNIATTAPIEVSAVPSKESYCLQATDYFLWALQRVYTRGEDRYLKYLYDSVGLIHGVDDRRTADYNVYYTRVNRLDATLIER